MRPRPSERKVFGASFPESGRRTSPQSRQAESHRRMVNLRRREEALTEQNCKMTSCLLSMMVG